MNPQLYKSFLDKSAAKCRADSQMVAKFNGGPSARKEAFQLFVQASFGNSAGLVVMNCLCSFAFLVIVNLLELAAQRITCKSLTGRGQHGKM